MRLTFSSSRSLKGAAVVPAAALFLCLALPAGARAADRVVDAARRGDAAAVRTLVERGSALDVADVDGATALHWAVHHDDEEMVRVLIARSAPVDAANRYGVGPLWIAALNANADIARMLLEAGADASAEVGDGETVLMTAARTGNADLVRLLLAKGADVNATERWGRQSALMWAAAEGHAASVKALLEHGADLHARSGPSPASRRPGRRADPEAAGLSPLMFAVRGGHREATKALLDAGGKIDEVTPEGNSLLHLAILNAHFELAALLLERGADPNVANAERLTPLHLLVHVRRPDWQTLPPPVPTGSLDSLTLMQRLIDGGADVNAQAAPYPGRMPRLFDEQIPPPLGGTTPLWLAATGPDVDAMQLLLAAGADPTLTDEMGATVLMAASGIAYRQGYRQKLEAETAAAVRLALEHGADVNAIDKNGNTALHGLALRGVNEAVMALVERGARLDPVNKDGKMPVDLAEDASEGRAQPHTAELLRRLMLERNIER